MNAPLAAPFSDDELALHLEGALPQERARQLLHALQEDAALQQRLHTMETITRDLGTLHPQLVDVDLVPWVHARLAAAPTPWWRTFWPHAAWVGVGAVLASALFMLRVPVVVPQEAAPVARGPAAPAPPWRGVDAYVVNQQGESRRLRDRMAAGDALAFAYTNEAPTPYRFLMVLRVDAAGGVGWYHPAHVDASQDPVSIPIQAGGRVELPDMVWDMVPRGTMSIVAIFSREALHVSQVEARVAALGAAARAWNPPLLVPDTAQHVMHVEVQ